MVSSALSSGIKFIIVTFNPGFHVSPYWRRVSVYRRITPEGMRFRRHAIGVDGLTPQVKQQHQSNENACLHSQGLSP